MKTRKVILHGCATCKQPLQGTLKSIKAHQTACASRDSDLMKTLLGIHKPQPTIEGSHTPTPWVLSDTKIISTSIHGETNYFIASTFGGEKIDKANAAFIVRAANEYADTQRLRNSHEELIQCAKELVDRFRRLEEIYFETHGDLPESPTGEVSRMNKAIAKAEGL